MGCSYLGLGWVWGLGFFNLGFRVSEFNSSGLMDSRIYIGFGVWGLVIWGLGWVWGLGCSNLGVGMGLRFRVSKFNSDSF